jgi:hypothetical protein
MRNTLLNMQQKNTLIFFLRRFDNTPSYLYKTRFIIAILGALLLLLSSCLKSTLQSVSTPVVENFFTTNVLNRNFVVNYASDSGIDITDQYIKDTFVLVYDSLSYYNGVAKASRGNDTTYTGTWSSNSDYSQLVINLDSPYIPAEFIFLNRSWKFTKKAFPIMQLAPWGSDDPKVLYMERL